MEDADWTATYAKPIGARIADARKARGWSIDQVGEKLGVSRGAVGHWETGKRAIKVQDLWSLCHVLGVSADKLLFGLERWPFERVSYEKVIDLEPEDRNRLEGGLLMLASEMAVDVKSTADDEVSTPRLANPASQELADAAEAALSSAGQLVRPGRTAGSARADAPAPRAQRTRA